MVGVAGRSKGCHTCRRRKIRCDQRKPACERCERTGRDCEGYARGTIFLNQMGFASAAHDKSRLDHCLRKGEARIQIFAATPETYNKRMQRQTSTDTTSDGTALSPTSSITSSLSSNTNLSLHLSASSRQLESLCLERISPIRSQQHAFSFSILAPQILASSNAEPVFLHAFNALKLSMPNPQTTTTAMIFRSRIEYGKALREMQKAIAKEPSRISDQVLVACTILKQYELQEISPRSAEAFDAHVLGHLELLKQRGAKTLRSTFGRAMVREIRYLDALTSLGSHKRCELASPEWRCPAVWEDAHDIRLSLIDVAADMGGIYEDFEALSPDCDPSAALDILQRTATIRRDLHFWHRRLCSVTSLEPPWPDHDEAPDRSQPPSPESNPDMPSIEIDTLEQQYLMLDFWAVRIIANQLTSLVRTAFPQQAWSQPGPQRSLEDNQIRLASNILAVAVPCMADECGIWGMLRVAWGIRNAYSTLGAFSSPMAVQLRAKLEACLTRMAVRDFRKAPALMQAPSKGVIEAMYGAASGSTERAKRVVELPDLLARPPV